MLADFVREKEREAFGIVPPEPVRRGASDPMTAHLESFVSDLKTRCSKKYGYNANRDISQLISELGWKRLADVTADSFVGWRARQKGKAPKTLNRYLAFASGLGSWMVSLGLAGVNPLAAVKPLSTRGREVRRRRALSADECRRLVSVAGSYGIVYAAALLTGLRRKKLRALVWGDVHLDAAEPYLDVRAATTKNRKAATIRLREDLVAGLVAMRPEGVKASVRVFTVPHNDTRRSHFRAAGIVEVDEMGMRADFHSLRHTFATNVRMADASAEEARLLMRHEDVRQTAGYTHLPATRTREVLDRLPSLGLRSPAVSDCGVGTPGGTLEIVRGSLDVSGAVVGRGLSGNENRPGLPGDCLVLSGSDWVCQGTTKSSVGRTRTYNQPVNSRLLYH